MLKLLRVVLLTLVCSLSTIAFGGEPQVQVVENKSINNEGKEIIQLINRGETPVTCFYKDEGNFYTFILDPNADCQWIIIYGEYSWGCK